LTQANLQTVDISGVGIGIAGASVTHSEDWLRSVMTETLPDVPAMLSSDLEIALVGALGQRQGVLILAGTGSAGFGVNSAGQSAQVGGWGYLLGDEGSSHWIGMESLKVLTRVTDGREAAPPSFVERLLTALELKTEMELIPWLYRSEKPRTREVAQLARIVIEQAADGVPIAVRICESAAQELAVLYRTVIKRLNMHQPPTAFAGGLLENDNILSQRLCELLGLDARPVPLHPPVIGAALLAQIGLRA
jgi:N-acetylglucosamine kinase-like BadF-type ATPase